MFNLYQLDDVIRVTDMLWGSIAFLS